MPNYISVLKQHEKDLVMVLGSVGIVAGGVLTAANREKIKAALSERGIPHETHATKEEIKAGRVHT